MTEHRDFCLPEELVEAVRAGGVDSGGGEGAVDEAACEHPELVGVFFALAGDLRPLGDRGRPEDVDVDAGDELADAGVVSEGDVGGFAARLRDLISDFCQSILVSRGEHDPRSLLRR